MATYSLFLQEVVIYTFSGSYYDSYLKFALGNIDALSMSS